MQQAPYPPAPQIDVRGSCKAEGGQWKARLRIKDETRRCGYRDRRVTLGPVHRGKGTPAPGTHNRRTAKIALDELIVRTRWEEQHGRTERRRFDHWAKRLTEHMEQVEHAHWRTVRDTEAVLGSRILPVFGHLLVDTITAAQVASYRDDLLLAGRLSPRSIRRDLGIVAQVLGRAVVAGELAVNVADAAHVKRPKLKGSGEFVILSPAQIRAVAQAAESPVDHAWTLLLGFCGLRLGESSTLRKRAIEGDRLTVTASKTGKTRIVPVALEVRRALAVIDNGDPDAYLFAEDGKRPSVDAFRRRFYEAVERAGLGHLRTGSRRLRVHDLRHSFVSNLLKAGVPAVKVQTWAGHSSLAITSIYAHHDEEAGDAEQVERALGVAA